MTEHVLIIIKPDAMSRGLMGQILSKLGEIRLKILAARILRVPVELAKEHYRHLKGKKFCQEAVDLISGNLHPTKHVFVFILSGANAISKCRKLVGATNPEEAEPGTIRATFGRITTKGVFENVIHASSDPKEAEREIKLWFTPDEIIEEIYPTKKSTINSRTVRSWV